MKPRITVVEDEPAATGAWASGFSVYEQNLTGDGDDWGWNTALHYKGDALSWGLSYRSSSRTSRPTATRPRE